MKNQKGITLIALVITIIVLLILAGITIAMLTGENGLLNKANSSKSKTVEAEAVEKINVTLSDVKAEIYKQQVSNSAYLPVSSSSLESKITTLLSTDGIKTTEAENDYWYSFADNTLTISYKNTAAGVSTVSGSIDLSKTPWTITKAELSTN